MSLSEDNQQADDAGLPGEREYVRARQLWHSEIPDFAHDAEYLELLGRAAELGYPRALYKLGDYAMRRGAWVEAYFWMYRARAAGMQRLEGVLRRIRITWLNLHHPDERANIHPLFSAEDHKRAIRLISTAST